MALFHDPAALFAQIAAPSAVQANAYADAINVLNIDDEAWSNRIAAGFHAIATKFLAGYDTAPTPAQISTAVDAIISAAATIDESLELLLRARITASVNAGSRVAVLTALYPSILEALLPGMAPFEWDENERLHAPLRGEFRRIGGRVSTIAAALAADNLDKTTRPIHPAFDEMIGQLHRLYCDVMADPIIGSRRRRRGAPASIARMVASFWPAVSGVFDSSEPLSRAPSSKIIRASLARLDRSSAD